MQDNTKEAKVKVEKEPAERIMPLATAVIVDNDNDNDNDEVVTDPGNTAEAIVATGSGTVGGQQHRTPHKKIREIGGNTSRSTLIAVASLTKNRDNNNNKTKEKQLRNCHKKKKDRSIASSAVTTTAATTTATTKSIPSNRKADGGGGTTVLVSASTLLPPDLNRQRGGFVPAIPGAQRIQGMNHLMLESSSAENATNNNTNTNTTNNNNNSNNNGDDDDTTTTTTDRDNDRRNTVLYDAIDINHTTTITDIQESATVAMPPPPTVLAATTCSTTIVTMTTAELVPEPICAVEVVNNDTRKQRKKRKFLCIFIVTILTVAMVCIVTTIFSLQQRNTRQPSSSSSSSSSSLPYACLRNTTELYQQQIMDLKESNYTTTKELYILCPNTTSIILQMHALSETDPIFDSAGVENFPLRVLLSNTTIQCGRHVEEYGTCRLYDGTIQLAVKWIEDPADALTFHRKYGPALGPTLSVQDWTAVLSATYRTSLNNITIRGLTFSGTINNGNDSRDTKFLGKSVSIDQPSDGILFDRCSWTSLSSSTGLIFITTAWKNNLAVQEKEEDEEKSAATTTTIESLSSHSTVVLLSNCSFTNIKYNFPLIATYDSSVIISDTTFDNIHLLPKENSCGVNESNYGTAFFQEAHTTSMNDTDTTSSDGGSGIVECAYVLACGGTASNCTIAGQSCLITPNVSVASPMESWLQVGNGSTYTINEASKDCGFG